MESLFVAAAVVALVELVKDLQAKDWGAVAKILGAAVIGGLAGYFHIDGLVVTSGVVTGLTAAGVYKLVK